MKIRNQKLRKKKSRDTKEFIEENEKKVDMYSENDTDYDSYSARG